ncbi:hypothetical protein M0811_10385 [Anaeramoeba ignava]|uniref:PAS domain-containing protein n=1 Tax=Anaeramoeba ignava TaxID=1746090 RepID=A0A9Q0R9E7_ANAIG|nr:hypothetical protein M0811_10385 [Anaeramoeba ignava]|eukprot:Anaeramoba_ignava/a2323_124.p1 GENE.a2323_124~~a2323_124.p1  ORF type:complete len:384 (-),score=135.37 a2323_124:111-1241(-)
MGNKEFSLQIPKKKLKRYMKSFNESKEPMIIVDNLTKIDQVNKAFLDLTGLVSETQIVGEQISLISAKEQPHLNLATDMAVLLVLKKVLQSETGTYNTSWLFGKSRSGNNIWVSVWITLLYLAGKPAAQLIIRESENPIKADEQEKLKQEMAPNQLKLDTSSDTGVDVDSDSRSQKSQGAGDQTRAVRTSSLSHSRSVEQTPNQVVLEEQIQKIQNLVKNMKNEKLEEKVSNNLNQISSSIQDAIKHKDDQINKLNERLQQERKEHRKKYEKLESHLQRRLGGMETEKSVKQSILEENLSIKRKLKQLISIIQKQNTITDELYSLIDMSQNTNPQDESFDSFNESHGNEFTSPEDLDSTSKEDDDPKKDDNSKDDK